MVSVIEERLGKLDEIELRKGGHSSFDDGVCAMELVAWLAGEPHSDHPKCASPVLTRFAMSWNDALDDEGRQRLKPLLPRIVGTAGDGHDEWRAWLATDWLVRVCAPAWLELAGVKESAAALRALPPIVSTAVARESQPVVDEARAAGAAARDAAGAAAGAAAWDAAWAAAGAAAGAAARDAAGAAARAAAGDAAWAAAWAAAWDAAWDAARAAARAAAGAAAMAAAGDAARAAAMAAAGDAARAAAGAAAMAAAGDAARAAAWDAARDAAGAALEPTKVELQASALVLFERMIEGPA